MSHVCGVVAVFHFINLGNQENKEDKNSCFFSVKKENRVTT